MDKKRPRISTKILISLPPVCTLTETVNQMLPKCDNRHHEGFNKIDTNKVIDKSGKNMGHHNDEFKCAFCLYPGLCQGKACENKKGRTRARKCYPGQFPWKNLNVDLGFLQPHMKKMDLYFDLPLETFRSSVVDGSPVTAAFFINKDPRWALKKGSTGVLPENLTNPFTMFGFNHHL